MEEALFLIQDSLNENLLNTDIKLDEYNYNLLLNNILDTINTAIPGARFNLSNLAYKFDESYIIISCIGNMLTKNESLSIYIKLKNNIIVNAEVSILS